MRKTVKSAKTPKTIHFDQWIEIEQIDGQTVVTYYPPNREFERLRQEKDPPPTLIYRRLNFVGCVPTEYLWTHPDEQAVRYGGQNLQRMTVEDWLEVMEREAAYNDTRIVPPRRYQLRPPEFGACPCDKCVQRRELEEEAERG